jgi:hypothetical protein
MEKTSWKTLVDWQSLSSSSMSEEEKILTIKSIDREEIVSNNGRKEVLPVCRFYEDVPPMALNKTNMRTMETITGSDKIEDWYGKKIVVYVQKNIKFGKDLVSGLRIKPVPKRLCSICGNVIAEEIYNASIDKYGTSLCSKECLEKYNSKGE